MVAKVIAAAAVAVALVLSPAVLPNERADAHPLHTSLAELSYDPKTGAVALSLRVFVDDFTKASLAFQKKQSVARPSAIVAGQSPLVAYALASFDLRDAHARRVGFVSCGGKRVGDLMWLCFRGQIPGGGNGLRVLSQIMFDTYRDQINIVQASYSGRKVNMLFTPGEAAKVLQ